MKQTESKLYRIRGGRIVEPIVVGEIDTPLLYRVLQPDNAGQAVGLFIERVFEIMLENDLVSVSDRKAIWVYWRMIENKKMVSSFHKKFGTIFPSDDFGNNCNTYSKEKVERTWNCGLICSHQNRNPQLNEWGGSHRLVFKLVDEFLDASLYTILTAPSGLKEWEDLALGLGAYYYAGLLRRTDAQLLDILSAADASVEGQVKFLPYDITITQYVFNLFDVIDSKMCRNNVIVEVCEEVLFPL